MMGFDFHWTCPDIDKGIAKIRRDLDAGVDEILEEACPLIEQAQRRKLAGDYAETLYGYIEEHIEAIRSTNEKMRREADRQIDKLEERIADLEAELETAKEGE